MSVLDARRGDLPDTLAADIAIVGAGAAGIVLALELADAGHEVILLEAGGEKFATASQEFYRAEAVAPESHGPVHMFRRRVLGGSTSVWGGRCIPFDPIDFEERPWIAHGRWPIRYEDVARFYPRALDYVDAGPPVFDAADALPGQPGPMVPGVASEDVVLDRIERFSHPLHFGRWYRAKLAAHPRIRALTHAPVEQVTTTAGGAAATGVLVRAAAGRSIRVSAPRTVIAAGGLETPRLLLSSDTEVAGGLGNQKDLVGRFYQCHLEGELGEIEFAAPDREVRIDYQRSPEGVYCRRYLWLSPEAQRRRQLAGLVLRPAHANIVDPGHRHPVLSAMYLVKSRIVPEYARKLTSLEDQRRLEGGGSQLGFWSAHARNMVLGGPKLLAFTADWTRRRILARRKLPSVVLRDPRRRYPLDVNAEQEPNADSRITLGDERDEHGIRRIRIDWRTSEADHLRLVEGLKTMQAALAPSGTATIRLTDQDLAYAMTRRIPVGGHHIGTARMASTPAEGVCDANGEVFGTSGLFLAGAATFSTSSFANPTLTLVALSLRLAEHLRGS